MNWERSLAMRLISLCRHVVSAGVSRPATPARRLSRPLTGDWGGLTESDAYVILTDPHQRILSVLLLAPGSAAETGGGSLRLGETLAPAGTADQGVANPR